MNLKSKIVTAYNKAKELNFDKTEILEQSFKFNKSLKKEELIRFTFGTSDCEVFVDDPESYLLLLKLTLEYVYQQRYQLSGLKFFFVKFTKKYQDWYNYSLEESFGYEMAQYQGAKKYTSLKCKLGVQFVVNEAGYVTFYPCIDFEGEAYSSTFTKYVLHAPVELSELDRVIAS